jgi:hypothetical protein
MLRDPARGPRSDRSPTAVACLVAEDLPARSLGWGVVEKWGAGLYGDPCRECGFGWKLSPAQAVASVQAVPDSYARRLAGATGRERHPDLAWTAAAYVSHVTDNLRTWAERLAGGYLAGDLAVPGGVVLQHATRGAQRAEDVARNNAHDAHHHLWDIDRILRTRTKGPHRPGM